MTTKVVVETLKSNKPKAKHDIEKLFELEPLGSGCYRRAYRIVGTNLIVKIESCGCSAHTDREMEILQRLRSNRALLKHLPQVLYDAPGLLVMPLYKQIGRTDQDHAKVDTLKELCRQAGVEPIDMHMYNVMADSRGNFRITDMGMFREKESI